MKNLLFFYGLECPHCKRMEKHVDKLITEGFEFEKIEIWHNKENEETMVKLDCEDEPCGGVPFFLNQTTHKTVCGEVPFKQLKEWAEGK
jgi:glutaredoxin